MVNPIGVKILLLFALHVACVSMSPEANCQERAKTTDPASRDEPESQRLNFRHVLSGNGERDGILTSRHVYVSDDGTKVSRLGEVYPSPVLANARVEDQLKEAVNVIERKYLFENKRKVGERVVAEFVADGGGPRSFVIFRTHNQVLVRIESLSLKHALAFEIFNKKR